MSAMDMDYAVAVTARRTRGRAPSLVAALMGALGWRADQRQRRLADLRVRELEREIERLRSVGGF